MKAFVRCHAFALFGWSVLFGGSANAADPTTADCLAAHDNSISLRNQHKLRAARSELLVCAAASCPADVRNECTRRVEEVNKAIPTIVFEAKDDAGNDLAAVSVRMDGQALLERLEGTSLSIDPGAHSFVFETAGGSRVERNFVIAEGEKDRRERVAFGAAASPAPAIVAAPPSVGESPGPAPTAADAPSSGSTQRILGWTAAGVGVLGLGLGAIFEVNRSSKLNDRDAVCPAGVDCPVGSQTRINSLTDQAKSASTMGEVSLIAGGLLVAGGLVLVFTAPTSASSGRVAVAPVLDLHFQGVMVSNVW